MINDIGLPMYLNLTAQNIQLYQITNKIINNLEIKNKKILDDMEFCNLNKEDLVGKYFDKTGNIYIIIDSIKYRFNLKIDELINIAG